MASSLHVLLKGKQLAKLARVVDLLGCGRLMDVDRLLPFTGLSTISDLSLAFRHGAVSNVGRDCCFWRLWHAQCAWAARRCRGFALSKMVLLRRRLDPGGCIASDAVVDCVGGRYRIAWWESRENLESAPGCRMLTFLGAVQLHQLEGLPQNHRSLLPPPLQLRKKRIVPPATTCSFPAPLSLHR